MFISSLFLEILKANHCLEFGALFAYDLDAYILGSLVAILYQTQNTEEKTKTKRCIQFGIKLGVEGTIHDDPKSVLLSPKLVELICWFVLLIQLRKKYVV